MRTIEFPMMEKFIHLLLFLSFPVLEAKPDTENFDNEINKSDYTYTTYSSSTSGGYNGYHYTSGGFIVLAIIVLILRLCLICYRGNSSRQTSRSIILVQQDIRPIADVIISRQRSNSKEDLTENAEPPAEDPPPPYENYGGHVNVHGNSAGK